MSLVHQYPRNMDMDMQRKIRTHLSLKPCQQGELEFGLAVRGVLVVTHLGFEYVCKVVWNQNCIKMYNVETGLS